MLTELRLTNFKAFGTTQRIPIKPITLIFGANSSGKSSILHSLLLANHALETGQFDVHSPRISDGMVDLGGITNYVHAHDGSRAVDWHLESPIDPEPLRTRMVGANEDEFTAFSRFTRFGATLRWGATSTLNRLEIQLDGCDVLAFARLENGKSSCEILPTGLEALAHEIHRMIEDLVWDSVCETKPDWKQHKSGGWYLDHPTPEARRQAELAHSEYERARAQHRQAFQPSPEQVAKFANVLNLAAKECDFTLKGFTPQSHWPEELRDWPQLQGQVVARDEGDGVFGRFKEFVTGGTDDPNLWSAAQALLFNLTNLVQCCSEQAWRDIADIRYIGPLRKIPSRYFEDDASAANSADRSSWGKLAANPGLVGDVNRWLRDALGTRYQVEIRRLLDDRGRERGFFPEFLDSWIGTSLSHRDLGFGMSQVLPVLVEAAANQGRLIAIEQPELHLHPAQQAELGDAFIESALGERKNSFILETHSEHLILRILRRIRQTAAKSGNYPADLPKLNPNDVAVLYVERTEAGSIVREMEVNERGEFVKAWPGGFFEEGLREVID